MMQRDGSEIVDICSPYICIKMIQRKQKLVLCRTSVLRKLGVTDGHSQPHVNKNNQFFWDAKSAHYYATACSSRKKSAIVARYV
jgi:hypothetical protein